MAKKPVPFYHDAFCGDTYLGQGITVAILDSSINVNHVVFQEHGDVRLTGKNFVRDERDDFWKTNRESHGTMVAGIVASVAKKSIHLLMLC